MNGNVFECYEEVDDHLQYGNTIEALDAYARKNLFYSADLAPLSAKEATVLSIERPEETDEEADTLSGMIFAEEVKEYVKRVRTLRSNLATVYAVAWGQCSEDMKVRVSTHDHYETKSAANDCVWLLEQIQSVKLQYHEGSDAFMSLLDALNSFLSCKQAVGQSADEYADRLVGWWETLEAHGGVVAPNHLLIKATDSAGNTRTDEQRKALARERILATALIRNADPSRYGTLIISLANNYALNRDEYPTDIAAAKSLLGMYRTPANASAPGRNGGQRNNTGGGAVTAPAGGDTGGGNFGATRRHTRGRNGRHHSCEHHVFHLQSSWAHAGRMPNKHRNCHQHHGHHPHAVPVRTCAGGGEHHRTRDRS